MDLQTDEFSEKFSPYEQLLLDSFDHHGFDILPESIGGKMHNRPQWDNIQHTLDSVVVRKDDLMVRVSNMSLLMDDELSATIVRPVTGDDYDDFVDTYEDAVETTTFLKDVHVRPDELYDAMTTEELLDTAGDIARYGGVNGTVEDILVDEYYSDAPDYDTALRGFLDEQEYTHVTITDGGAPDGLEQILDIAELSYEERQQLHDTYHSIDVHARKYLRTD